MSGPRGGGRGLTRRRFLVAVGGAGAAAILGRSIAGGSADRPAGSFEVERSGRALGTEIRIVARHDSERVARAAVDAAFAEVDAVEDVLSLYREESQLARLNRDGRLEGPHPWLVEVLEAAGLFWRATGGAFDATVQPLWEAHAAGRDAAAARGRVGWGRVSIERGRVATAAGTALTLNGIGQGFATDRAVATLLARGVRHALVDAGEFGALGERPGGGPWRIGIRDPRRPEGHIARLGLDGRFVATSGDDAPGAREHVFDPRTGEVARSLRSATVAARRGIDADALSTALFVLGPEDGLALVESFPGADALVVTAGGRTMATSGFPLST